SKIVVMGMSAIGNSGQWSGIRPGCCRPVVSRADGIQPVVGSSLPGRWEFECTTHTDGAEAEWYWMEWYGRENLQRQQTWTVICMNNIAQHA
ncbi:MAG: hypothetical protein ACKPKO_24770, partial [Candidatus Fonsibacter sp.]